MRHPDALLSSVHARRGHFVFESGHHGDLWLDLEQLCTRPEIITPLAADLAARLRSHRVDAVCGPLNEGAFIALFVAADLGCDFTYAERFVDPARRDLFPVEYRIPRPLHALLRGRRVAIVNDVVSAGSAVRGAFTSLRSIGAQVVAVGSLAVLGAVFEPFARDNGLCVETLSQAPHNLWTPDVCPLCNSGTPAESVGS